MQLVTTKSSARVAGVLVLLLCTLWPAANAWADATTGTWTGSAELRGNYYWETSTRVTAPEANLRVVAPNGVEVRAGYLVDAITSASLASGVVSDVRFTEVRNQGVVGTGYEFDLGNAQLRTDASFRLSHEPDYLSLSGTVGTTLSLNDRSTLIGASLGFVHDEVGRIVRGQGGGVSLSNRGIVGRLDGVNLTLSLTQLLTPNLSISGGYELVHNWGYLQNAYRAVMVQGLLRPEQHPDLRTRNTLFGRASYYIEPTRSAVHVYVRLYEDDWSILAVNPELRVYQRVTDDVTLRFRYRYYIQSQAAFYDRPENYQAADPFVTADPKMSAFESHMIGAHALLGLRFLDASFLGFLAQGSFDLSVDYLMQTNRFGNALIAQCGIAVPF